jgi:hypothetical protein
MNFFKRRKILRKANYLELTPYRIAGHETDENGKAMIVVPKFRSEFWKELLIPRRKTPYYRINLDELGSATWLEIDGKKNVGEICRLLTGRFGEKISPAEERITKFLTKLYDQRYISFMEISEKEF